MREQIEKMLKDGATTQQIMKKTGCSDSYVYQVRHLLKQSKAPVKKAKAQSTRKTVRATPRLDRAQSFGTAMDMVHGVIESKMTAEQKYRTIKAIVTGN